CFIKSRRGHTSFSRDWSSDVCSSDLVVIDPDQRIELRDEFRDLIVPLGRPDGEQVLRRHLAAQGIAWEGELPDQTKAWIPKARRSEERRVGNERNTRSLIL